MSEIARIIEIFPSIQGEGVYVGQPHLFVRFWNCNLACAYCDTDYKGPYQEYSAQQLLAETQALMSKEGPFHAMSLTGGEPLLWWKFLKEFLPSAKQLGPQIYLETNGTLPDALRVVLPWIGIVAMDIKPPSATRDQGVWESHEVFLRMAAEAGKDLFVKIVLTKETVEDELERAFRLISAVDRRIPLVLQPVTPWGAVLDKPEQEQLNRWRVSARRHCADVRVIPQVHRILGVR